MSLYRNKTTKKVEDKTFDTFFDYKIMEIDLLGSIDDLVCTNDTIFAELLDEDEEIIKAEIRREKEFKRHVTAALEHIRPDLTGKQTERFIQLFKAAASTLTPQK